MAAPKSLPPSQTRSGAFGDPAHKIPKLLAESIVETQVVEPLVLRLRIVFMLPIEIDVIEESQKTQAAIAADHVSTASFTKFQERVGRRSVHRTHRTGTKFQ